VCARNVARKYYSPLFVGTITICDTYTKVLHYFVSLAGHHDPSNLVMSQMSFDGGGLLSVSTPPDLATLHSFTARSRIPTNNSPKRCGLLYELWYSPGSCYRTIAGWRIVLLDVAFPMRSGVRAMWSDSRGHAKPSRWLPRLLSGVAWCALMVPIHDHSFVPGDDVLWLVVIYLLACPHHHHWGLSFLIMLVAWAIWRHHKGCIFDDQQPSVSWIIYEIKDEARLWAKVGATSMTNLLLEM
jgi:hypothetical protein